MTLLKLLRLNGFKVSEKSTIDVIEDVLNGLRPMIQRDGGNIEFVSMKDGNVYVRLQGACISCPASFFTLKFGIEEALKARLSEVKEVIPI